MPRVAKKAASKAATEAPEATSEKTTSKKAASKKAAATQAKDPSEKRGYQIKGENYVPAKTASGGKSYHSGDAVAQELEGKDLDAVYKMAAKETGVKEADLREKYEHLNVGLQRMSLGNRIRGARNKAEETEAA